MKKFIKKFLSACIKIFFKKNIIGIYNLSQVPISFNFIDFCFFLEFKRKIKNKKKVHIFILDPNLNVLKFNNFQSINKKKVIKSSKSILTNRDHFFNKMISSLYFFDKFSFSITSNKFLQLLGDNHNNIFCFKTDEKSDYEKSLDYIYNYPNYINKNSINPSISATKILNEWLDKNKVNKNKIITLHLRDQVIEKKFNSIKDEWYKFCKYLKKKNFTPIIIDDLDNLSTRQVVPEILKFDNATYDLNIRLALSKISRLNIIMQRGVATSLIYLNCNYLIINPKIRHPSYINIKKIIFRFKNPYNKKRYIENFIPNFKNLKIFFLSIEKDLK